MSKIKVPIPHLKPKIQLKEYPDSKVFPLPPLKQTNLKLPNEENLFEELQTSNLFEELLTSNDRILLESDIHAEGKWI